MQYHITKELNDAKELRSQTLQRLAKAGGVADRTRIVQQIEVAHRFSLPGELKGFKPLAARSAALQDYPTKSAKKPRRKWLPPLGPPSAQQSVPEKPSGVAACEWLHTSAEVFASLSDCKPAQGGST